MDKHVCSLNWNLITKYVNWIIPCELGKATEAKSADPTFEILICFLIERIAGYVANL